MAESGMHGPGETGDNPKSTPDASTHTEFVTRRALRAAEAKAARRSRVRDVVVRRDTAPAKPTTGVAAAGGPAKDVRVPTAPPRTAKPKKSRRGVLNLVVMTFAAGIVATMALPAYAFNPETESASHFGTSAIDGMKKADSQTFRVDDSVAQTVVKRDSVSATTQAELDARKAAAAAEAERQRIAEQFQAYQADYSGPSVADMLANPPNPNYSLAAVFATAKQYIGTPYVYGGATPAGFDCSGYVMYVFAQFGISLPHSVSGQAARGTRIPESAAQPGDLVVYSGHIGFYAGNGNIMDAPDVGRSVSIRPIWGSPYFVRIGI